MIIERASVEGPDWPFAVDRMKKFKPTPRLVEARDFAQRACVAETQIGPAVRVLGPRRVKGASVLLVLTGGLTLREVARKLLDAGASEVFGLARTDSPSAGDLTVDANRGE